MLFPKKQALEQKFNILAHDYFNPELTHPHSSLNLIPKSKISPSIYKYKHQSRDKQKKWRNDRERRSNSFYEFKSIIISETDSSNKGFKVEMDTNKYMKSNNNNNRFPRRTNYLRSKSNFKILSQSQINLKSISSSFFDLKTMKGRSLNFQEAFRARSAGSNMNNPSKKQPMTHHSQRRTFSQIGKRRSSSRFSPWDLASGFGKKKRFDCF